MISPGFIRQVGVARWLWRYARLQFNKRILARGCSLRLPTGSIILLPKSSQSATEVYLTGADVDWGSEAVMARFADRARDFLDIGAHIGYYSAYLAPCVRKAYAFEPDPRNIPGLLANSRLAKNIAVNLLAVSSRTGFGQLFVGGSSAASSLVSFGDESITVAVITVDDFLIAHPEIDPAVIKTDVEGNDLAALRGMSTTIARHQPLVLTECGDACELLELCAEHQYMIFAFCRDRETQKIHFQQFFARDFAREWFKMLFLVPKHLHEEFRRMMFKHEAGGHQRPLPNLVDSIVRVVSLHGESKEL